MGDDQQDDLRAENDWNAHPDDLEDLPFGYEWLNTDTNSTYFVVIVRVQEESRYFITVNQAVRFDDTPVYWSRENHIRTMENGSITYAPGGGSAANTNCTEPGQPLTTCPGFSGEFNATGQSGGRLDPGLVVFTTATFGASAASSLMTASFSSEVEVVAMYEGATRLFPLEARISEDRTSFEGSFTLEESAYIATRVYRTTYEGPVTIEHPDGTTHFERSSFGWIDDEGLYMEQRPHVISGPGEYRISAQGGPPDESKPSFLLAGVMLKPDFFRHFETE